MGKTQATCSKPVSKSKCPLPCLKKSVVKPKTFYAGVDHHIIRYWLQQDAVRMNDYKLWMQLKEELQAVNRVRFVCGNQQS